MFSENGGSGRHAPFQIAIAEYRCFRWGRSHSENILVQNSFACFPLVVFNLLYLLVYFLIATEQYKAGLVDFPSVLDAQRDLNANEDQLVTKSDVRHHQSGWSVLRLGLRLKSGANRSHEQVDTANLAALVWTGATACDGQTPETSLSCWQLFSTVRFWS